MGFEQVFDNCQICGCFEETDSVSRPLFFEPLFLNICNFKQILT